MVITQSSLGTINVIHYVNTSFLVGTTIKCFQTWEGLFFLRAMVSQP
jgi:hypothetical protein